MADSILSRQQSSPTSSQLSAGYLDYAAAVITTLYSNFMTPSVASDHGIKLLYTLLAAIMP
jgi:phosphomannomutase